MTNEELMKKLDEAAPKRKKVRGQAVYTVKEKLEKNSILNTENGCIEWQSTLSKGYGKVMVGSRTDGTRANRYAHRLSYEQYVGKIPDGLFVCHHCDNRKCINPEHLFVGTNQDNVDDRQAKGRNKTGNLNINGHPNAKLSWEKVREIRKNEGKYKQKELAKKYGVLPPAISAVINNINWKIEKDPDKILEKLREGLE